MARHTEIVPRTGAKSYAVVHDVAASWHEYQHIAAALTGTVPDGLILLVAGPTDEGFRLISVWDNEQAWRDFHSQRLQPAIAALRRRNAHEPAVRDLHPIHIVIGHLGCLLHDSGARGHRP
jgi:hypothetical protein